MIKAFHILFKGLLVVATICIVVYLTLFLFTGIGFRLRDKSLVHQCANNLRKIGVAWHLYLEDHDNYFPKYGDGIGECDYITFGGKRGIQIKKPAKHRVLNPYIGVDVSKDINEVEKDPKLKLFHCPADISTFSKFKLEGTSYHLNYYLIYYSPSGDGEKTIPRPLSSITVPHSKLSLVKDGSFHDGSKSNILFLDGHVRTFKRGDYISGGYEDPTPGDGSLSK